MLLSNESNPNLPLPPRPVIRCKGMGNMCIIIKCTLIHSIRTNKYFETVIKQLDSLKTIDILFHDQDSQSTIFALILDLTSIWPNKPGFISRSCQRRYRETCCANVRCLEGRQLVASSSRRVAKCRFIGESGISQEAGQDGKSSP